MTRMRMGRFAAVLLLSGAVVAAVACGGDDDDGGSKGGASACMVLCPGGISSCTDGITEAQCQSSAQTDCGGPAEAVSYKSGCSCPGWGEADECTDVPDWAQ